MNGFIIDRLESDYFSWITQLDDISTLFKSPSLYIESLRERVKQRYLYLDDSKKAEQPDYVLNFINGTSAKSLSSPVKVMRTGELHAKQHVTNQLQITRFDKKMSWHQALSRV